MIPGLGYYFCLSLLIRSESACSPTPWQEAVADNVGLLVIFFA